jgi:Fic family protein
VKTFSPVSVGLFFAFEPNKSFNRLMKYNWQQKDWRNFKYDTEAVEELQFEFSEHIGRTSGILKGLTEATQTETVINMMVSEAIKTSEIEGEYLNIQDVMSSIKRNLGLKPELPLSKDKKDQGISELMIAVRESFHEPMNTLTLFSWHSMLMIGSRNIAVGKWRSHEEPMQIVSGGIGREIVHYEAPLSKKNSSRNGGI